MICVANQIIEEIFVIDESETGVELRVFVARFEEGREIHGNHKSGFLNLAHFRNQLHTALAQT